MPAAQKTRKPTNQDQSTAQIAPPIPPDKDRLQAAALQRLTWRRFVTIDALPADSQDFDVHERAVSLLCKLADAWQVLVTIKRELRGIPRAGQLSASERAEMRRAKSSRSRQSAPKLSAKESVISGPTVPTVPGGGGAT